MLIERMNKLVPESLLTRIEYISGEFGNAVGGYFRAQFKIMLIIFAVLLIYTRRDLKRRSVLFLYMVIYGIERFIIEYFRYDEIRGIFLGLSTSQWISIALVIGGIVGFILLRRAEKNMPAEAAVPTDENSEITDGPNVSADAGEAKPEDGPDAAPADDAEAKPADEAEAKPDDDTKPAPVDEEANGDVTDPVSE